MIGSQDLLVALAIAMFFLGAKKLPELSRSLGQALSEFKKGVAGSTDDAPPEGVTKPKARAASADGPSTS